MHLYHNAISTCSQKVRMVLHEKKLSYDETAIDLLAEEQHSESYLKINPKAVVPTLLDNNETINESSLINEYLDDGYPEIPLRPDSALQRHQMRILCKTIDDELHIACAALTFGIVVRPGLLGRPEAEIDAMLDKIKDEKQRTTRREVIKNGIQSDAFKQALFCNLRVFDEAEAMLSKTQYLAGNAFSLADCTLIPYVLRFDQLGQGKEINKRPSLALWYHKTRQRPAYDTAIKKWMPNFIASVFEDAGKAVQKDIHEILNQF